MTDIEHLEDIYSNCISRSSCAGCEHYKENKYCIFVKVFHSRPYRWNLETFEGAINHEKT